MTAKRSTPQTTVNQEVQRNTTPARSYRPNNSAMGSLPQQKTVTRTTSQRQTPSSTPRNKYFKPVDWNRSIRVADVDTRFSYVDIDGAPKIFDLDVAPDIVEIDLGPSAVSHELVRSPIEIKISSLLKNLLQPTPTSSDTAPPPETPQEETSTRNRSLNRPENPRTAPAQDTPYSQDHHYRGQVPTAHRLEDPVEYTGADEWSKGNRPSTHSQDTRLPGYATPYDYDSNGWGGEETPDKWVAGQDDVAEWGQGPAEELIGVSDMLAVDEPTHRPVQVESGDIGYQSGVNWEYSPPRVDPPQVDGPDLPELGNFGGMLHEPDAPFADAVDPWDGPSDEHMFGPENNEYAPEASAVEPAVDPGIGEDMFGLSPFEESVEEAIETFGGFGEVDSDPLFPEVEDDSFDEPNDWLTF